MTGIKKAVVGAVAVLALAACSSTAEDDAASTPEASSSTSTEKTPVNKDKPETTAPETTEEASPYVTLKSPSEAFLTYNERSYWTDNEDCAADMVEGTTFEGYRAKSMTCYTASNYESVTVTVMDDAEGSKAAVLDACGPDGWMQGCFAGPGWVIETETKESMDEVLASLAAEKGTTAPSPASTTAQPTAEVAHVDCTSATELDRASVEPDVECLPGQDASALSTLVNKNFNADEVDWSLYCTNGANDRYCGNTPPGQIGFGDDPDHPMETQSHPYFPEDANPSDEDIQNERNAEQLCSPSSGISEEERVELCFGGDADHDGIPDDEQ